MMKPEQPIFPILKSSIVTVGLIVLAVLAWPVASVLAAEAQATRRKTLAPTPTAGSMYLYPERIPLEAGGLMSAERGVIFVPLNRSKPGSQVISLDIYRFRAADPHPGAPPIFYLFGGPNFGGLEPLLARPGYYESRLRALHASADLVVVSQRGIGPSKPTTLIEGASSFPLDKAVTEDERAEAIRSAAVRQRKYWTDQGLDLRGFTVLEAAMDLNDVRKALGYDKVVLWGGSFGSHWAMATMRLLPDMVARVVLRGMEGPDHTYDMPSYVLNSVKRLAAEADAAPALTGLVPPGGMMKAFETVLERVSTAPVLVQVKDAKTGVTQTVRFGPEDVRGMVTGYTASAASRNGMRTWAADILRLYHGDFSAAAELRVRSRETESFRTASYFMLDCGSGISPGRRARLMKDPAAAIVGALGFNYRTACPVWDIDLGDDFRKNFETSIPTVIAQGDYDVSTPLENALELSPFFKNSRFVVVRGGSHPALDDAMDAAPEFAKAVLSFARTGDMSGLPKEVALPPIRWEVPVISK
jgi:pimeloyl-ACP methyl ester carboxylesterase